MTGDRGTGATNWLWLSAVIMVLDQASKWIIVQNLMIADRITVSPMLDITRLHNTGAAFSFLHDAGGWQRWFFVGLALAISIAIMIWLRKLPARGQGMLAAGLALIVGGALGNAIDRVRYGHVVDFISVHYQDWYYPAFNVADSAITVGAAFLILDSLLDWWRQRRDRAA